MKYVCTACGRHYGERPVNWKCECGAPYSLDFIPPAFDSALVDRDTPGLFRYRAFMPPMGDSWRSITMGEGMTPVVRVDEQLTAKLEYMMPTSSFKDRGACVIVSQLADRGVKRAIIDSSGNAGVAVSAYCARAGIECHVYVPEGTSKTKTAMIAAHGAVLTVVPGSRDECARVCRESIGDDAVYASHVFDPVFYEGTKTMAYEIFEQLGRLPRHILVPAGNGTMLLGLIRGLEHLVSSGVADMPHVIAVQSENCAPLYREHNGLPDMSPVPTLAEGIAIGEPARRAEMLGYIDKYGFDIWTAPESGIMDARNALAKRGISGELTSACVYAAYLAHGAGKLTDVLMPVTGAGAKTPY